MDDEQEDGNRAGQDRHRIVPLSLLSLREYGQSTAAGPPENGGDPNHAGESRTNIIKPEL